ncbi:MAG TPA: hypothetical protein VNF74_09135 [Terriglobales bacterium]|nr:hypothetical protein [Terriglobales bacterium]
MKPSFIYRALEEVILSRHILFDIEVSESGEQVVRWLRASGAEFWEPFFQMTVNRVVEKAQRRMFLKTGSDALFRQSSRRRCLYPSGFIFHIGRCGSTLLSNMIGATSRHFVLSEPHLPSTAMLLDPKRCSPARWRELMRAGVLALGGVAPRSAERFFIKFFHGQTLALPLIREAVPRVPEAFVYRDPVEVTMSLLTTPSASWFWHEYLTGLPVSAAVERPLVELAARMVGRTLQAMWSHVREDTVLLNYNEMGPETPGRLMSAWGLESDPDAERLAVQALTIDAKDPVRRRKFIPDSDRKRNAATPYVRDVVATHALEPYLKLEGLRAARVQSQSQPWQAPVPGPAATP